MVQQIPEKPRKVKRNTYQRIFPTLWYICDMVNLWKPYILPKRHLSKEKAIQYIDKHYEGNHHRYHTIKGYLVVAFGLKVKQHVDHVPNAPSYEYTYQLTRQEKKSYRTILRRHIRGWTNRSKNHERFKKKKPW